MTISPAAVLWRCTPAAGGAGGVDDGRVSAEAQWASERPSRCASATIPTLNPALGDAVDRP